MCPFDYKAFVVSGNVGIPQTGLITPVGWLSSPQLTVLSRSSIAVYSKFLVAVFLVLSRCFLHFSIDVGVFVIGLSQISSFFSF